MTFALAGAASRRAATPLRAAAIVCLLLGGASVADGAAPADLSDSVDVQWSNAPLRPTLQRLADATDVDLFLDRRVDSNLRLTLTRRGAPLREVLGDVTAPHGLGYTRVGPVVYIGPIHATRAAPALGDFINTPGALKRRAALAWPRLSEPRRILLEQMPEVGALLANPEAVPHDLWPAGSLPKMRRGDQLTLVLIGFGLTWEPTGTRRSPAVKVVPIDARLGSRDGAKRRVEEAARSVGATEQRFSLKVSQQPLRAVLRQIAERVGRRLVVEPAAADRVDLRVSFDVRRVSLEELVRVAAAAADLAAGVGESEIVISAP